MNKIRNSNHIKIVSAFSVILIAGFQWYIFTVHKDRVLRSSDFITVPAEIVEHVKFDFIRFRYAEKETGREKIVSRELSGNFDPFVHLQPTDKVSLTYDRGKQGTFYLDGYENKPSGLIFYFLFLIALIAQAIFIAVLFDKMDERHWSYKK